MERAMAVVCGIPLFLLACDTLNWYAALPPSPLPGDHLTRTYLNEIGPIGDGHNITINYCRTCLYSGYLDTMKEKLEKQFPGISVALVNNPPSSSQRRILGKMIHVAAIGAGVSVLAGDQVFPRLGISPPQWFHRICAKKIFTIYAIMLSRKLLHSMVQTTGAFDVYLDGELVFSKLDQLRFIGEIELRDIISNKLRDSTIII